AGRAALRESAIAAAGVGLGADCGAVRIRAAAGPRVLEFSFSRDAARGAGARACSAAGVGCGGAVRDWQPAAPRTAADPASPPPCDRRFAPARGRGGGDCYSARPPGAGEWGAQLADVA